MDNMDRSDAIYTALYVSIYEQAPSTLVIYDDESCRVLKDSLIRRPNCVMFFGGDHDIAYKMCRSIGYSPLDAIIKIADQVDDLIASGERTIDPMQLLEEFIEKQL